MVTSAMQLWDKKPRQTFTHKGLAPLIGETPAALTDFGLSLMTGPAALKAKQGHDLLRILSFNSELNKALIKSETTRAVFQKHLLDIAAGKLDPKKITTNFIKDTIEKAKPIFEKTHEPIFLLPKKKPVISNLEKIFYVNLSLASALSNPYAPEVLNYLFGTPANASGSPLQYSYKDANLNNPPNPGVNKNSFFGGTAQEKPIKIFNISSHSRTTEKTEPMQDEQPFCDDNKCYEYYEFHGDRLVNTSTEPERSETDLNSTCDVVDKSMSELPTLSQKETDQFECLKKLKQIKKSVGVFPGIIGQHPMSEFMLRKELGANKLTPNHHRAYEIAKCLNGDDIDSKKDRDSAHLALGLKILNKPEKLSKAEATITHNVLKKCQRILPNDIKDNIKSLLSTEQPAPALASKKRSV